jgi:aldehyde dehydrogenase (NAD+)
VLGNEEDVQLAVEAAEEALKTFSQTSKKERIQYLRQLHDAVEARIPELIDVMVREYGGTYSLLP